MPHHDYIWMCPVCQRRLGREEDRLLCSVGHSFDVAREGYVNLLLAHHRSSSEAGDPPDSLRNRQAFLEAGHYTPLAMAVNETVMAIADTDDPVTVLDIGCGEGYYLRKLREATDDSARLFGVDISRTAVSLAARDAQQTAFAVGNNFRLPVLPTSVDVLLQVMAPSAPDEIARVLRTDGVAVIVVPGPLHLQAFRAHVYEDAAQPHQVRDVYEGFSLHDERRVRFPIRLESRADVAQLIEMSPYKWHMDPGTYEKVRRIDGLEDTAEFVVQEVCATDSS